MDHGRLLQLISCIDLTSLDEADTDERIAALCLRAKDPGAGLPPVAAVCVYPRFVSLVKRELEGSAVRVATVSAFPEGRATGTGRAEEIERAITAGAQEIDAVLDPAALEDPDRAASEIGASKRACGEHTLKVILETGRLGSAERIRRAAELAIRAGADFIKTSTGKYEVGATPEAARTVMEAIRDYRDETGRRVGVKVAGGVRTGAQAASYLELLIGILGGDWVTPRLFRIGSSSLLDDLVPQG